MARLHGTGVVPRGRAAGARRAGRGGAGQRARRRTCAATGRTPPTASSRSTSSTAYAGDVAARFHVRAQEAHESLRLLREVARRGCPRGPSRVAAGRRAGGRAPSALGAAEGPRGASWVWLRAGADGTVDRLRLRSASFANWPVVAAAVPGDLVPDFPLINKSFELCYACTDR